MRSRSSPARSGGSPPGAGGAEGWGEGSPAATLPRSPSGSRSGKGERSMKRRRQTSGFTLIELLISIALMMILMIAVTMIFVNTTETVAVNEARMTVYTNARYAMDIMENDLLGAYGLNEPQ